MKRGLEVLVLITVVALAAALSRHPSPAPTPTAPSPCPPELAEYNAYLTQRLHDVVWERAQPPWEPGHEEWAVVSYVIAQDGRLTDLALVSRSSPHAQTDFLLGRLRAAAPLRPLPEGVPSVHGVELWWWTGSAKFAPATLEWQLSKLDDGRWLRIP